MKPLRVVVWGLGPHALRNLLPAVRTCSGLMLYGVCSRNAEVVSSTAEQERCAGWTDPACMLRDEQVDVVFVATPIGLHAAHGTLVLNAGKHCWCEKPFAQSAVEAVKLAQMSRDRGLTIGEGFMYLYHSQFIRLQDVVQSGQLGSIRSVTCRFGIPPLDRPGFRNDPELGGGAFLDVGSYPVSAAAALFPEAQPDIRFVEIVTARDSSVDTAGRVVLRYPNDVSAMLEWDTRCAYRNEIDIWGTTGSVSSERVFSKPMDHVPRFRFLDGRGHERYEEGTAENHFVSMLAAFRARLDDAVGAEQERVAIVRRATISDRIREQA